MVDLCNCYATFLRTLVNIFATGTVLELKPKQYKVDILGGWNVNLGQFKLKLHNQKTGTIIEPEGTTLWPVQSIIKSRRAKRIFRFSILEPGSYELEISNPETISVKPSNLWITSNFQAAVPNEQLDLAIG